MTFSDGSFKLPSHALTKADYDALARNHDRPLTDRPVGTHTVAKRDIDAMRSAVHATTDETERAAIASAIVQARRNGHTPADGPIDPTVTYEPCGSEDAYKRHRSNGETACLLCRQAHARYKASRG